MQLFPLIATILTLAAAFSYINARWIKLPMSIGLMIFSAVLSILLLLSSQIGIPVQDYATRVVGEIDFNQVLMECLLSFLLFAGALHINLGDLAGQKWIVSVLASVGVVGSTLLVGSFVFYVGGALGVELPFIYCLLFGALITPTDPIAVLGILKGLKTPKSLETKIAGESLFNDGIGVVVFLVILKIATQPGADFGPSVVITLLAQEALGGVVFGLILGGIGYWLISSIDDYHVEILVTLALVAGGYSLALKLHTSGPIAIVVAGLLIGNHGRYLAMSEKTREHLDLFWAVIDEILNAILFVIIGLEILIIPFNFKAVGVGLMMIPFVLLARFICVGGAVQLLRFKRTFTPHAVKILTWGGLRGGISIALALSIPPGPYRSIILNMTYIVVAFSIIVQGLTMKPLLQKTLERNSA